VRFLLDHDVPDDIALPVILIRRRSRALERAALVELLDEA
jgi:hypothetical protein